MPVSIALATLGCKVNQSETAAIEAKLNSRGYISVPFSEPAQVYIINTCAVTGKSGAQSRQMVRSAIRTNPEALVVVTGCYVQADAERLARIPGVDLILGQGAKPQLDKYLGSLEKRTSPKMVLPALSEKAAWETEAPGRYSSHTRVWIKCQDGCSACCSYCIVPRVRGPARSLPLTAVLRQIEQSIAEGYQEIVLCGIHIGVYGRDLTPPGSLAALLQKALSLPGLGRIRLSSIEPAEFTPELEEILTDAKLCPHLHIPLQSGHDEILRAMNRPYSSGEYAALIRRLSRRIPDLGIGTDIIAGFPGETDVHFNATLKLITELPFTYLHVFRYSPRANTPAAGFSGRVPEAVKKNRSASLRTLSQEKADAFRKTQAGQVRPTLILQQQDPSSGLQMGLTDNYLRLQLPPSPELTGRIHPLRIRKANRQGLYGEPAEPLHRERFLC